METSIFLAKFWGWYLLVFFFILSFNPIRIKQIFEDLNDQKFLIIVAFLAIIIGLVNILFHNVWKPDWRFLITMIGWFSLFFGLALFILPEQSSKWLAYINVKLVQILYVLLFLTGLYLLNVSYQILQY